MTTTRVYFSEAQRVVNIEASREFAPGNGALEAIVDPVNASRVIARYAELMDQSGELKQVLGPIIYSDILREDYSPSGANITETIDYLNDEFAKGIDLQSIESPTMAFTQQSIVSNPQDKFNESLTLIGGTYRVDLSFVAWCTTTNRSVAAYLNVNGTQATPDFSKEPKDIRDRFWPNRNFIVQLPKGTHEFNLKYGRNGGGGNSFAIIQDALLIVERVGA